MNIPRILAVVLMATALGACSSNRTTVIDEPSTVDGLQPVRVKNMEAVYRRPGADFSQYRRLLIRDVDIAFSQGWERSQNSATRTWSSADSERIKRELASLFASTVRRELEVEGGYEIVKEPGQDVLEIRPSIIDLYINAPDLSRTEPGIVRRYTTDAGRMTLVAELRRRRYEIEDADDIYAERLTVTANFDGELQLDELNRALDRLPRTQKEALLLACAGGLPYGRVADVCGVAIGTVKSRIARGRAELIDRMGERWMSADVSRSDAKH